MTEAQSMEDLKLLMHTLQMQCMRDSEKWFPELAHDAGYHLIALVGEVGEFANLVKKVDRGSLELDDVMSDMQEEIVDVFIYLLCLATIMGVDLVQGYVVKRAMNTKRFEEPDEE